MSARGQVRSMSVSQLLSLLVSVAFLPPLLGFGALGVAWAFTFGQAASAVYTIYMTRTAWSFRVAELLRWPVVATLAGVAGGEAVGLLPVGDTAIASAATFFALYVVLLVTVNGTARRALGLSSAINRG